MFSLSSAFFATLLTGASASFQSLEGYEPKTNIADHAAGVAIDQSMIAVFVGLNNEPAFQAARDVYEHGGNSQSYAEITLVNPLPQSVVKGTEMTFDKDDGTTLYGTAYESYDANVLTIGFLYGTGESYDQHVNCKVGGLPSDLQVTSGCITMEDNGSNTVTIGGDQGFFFTTVENKNGRTIQMMSTDSKNYFRPGADPNQSLFGFYLPYRNYYGTASFADNIVLAGLTGTDTAMSNGNIYFQTDDNDNNFRSRAEIVRHAAAYLNVGQFLMREVWDSITDCIANKLSLSAESNLDAVHALDEAVALYVGSEGEEGELYYGLAERRAYNFATASKGTDGTAEANRKIIIQFRDMQSKLNDRQCDAATNNANEIARLMYIPLIQGTLRFAYINSQAKFRNAAYMAEGAIFAAAILPIVHECDSAAANTIYQNSKMGSDPTKSTYNFELLKAAFESVYECMKIECSDIGGLVDPGTGGTSYFETAEPCGGYSSLYGPNGAPSSDNPNVYDDSGDTTDDYYSGNPSRPLTTPSQPKTLNSSDSDDELSAGAIFIILIAVVVGVLLFSLVVWKFICQAGGKKTERTETSGGDVEKNVEVADFTNADPKVEAAEFT